MDLIIAPNSVPLAQADVVPTSGTPQLVTNGNPATGVPASEFPAYHYNLLVQALVHLIDESGLARSGSDTTRLFEALQALFAATWITSNGSTVLPSGLIIQTLATPQVQLGAANTSVSYNFTFPKPFPNKCISISGHDGAGACISWDSFANVTASGGTGYVWSGIAGTQGSPATGYLTAIGY